MDDIKNIHFVGIKGVGMTALAIIAKEAGLVVTGSDIAETFITDAQLQRIGIVPYVGFSADHVTSCDLVITTGAHGGYDNIEVQTAKANGIKVLTQGEAVGVFMQGNVFNRDFTGISVAGTHGKTTTSAMIATLLKENQLDPTYVVGTGNTPSLGMSGHYGNGEYFVAEADEYATEPVHDKTPKLLWHCPKIAVITNIELDHPDVYNSVEDMRRVFLQFARKLPTDGVLITCGDDPQVQTLLREYDGKVITYGFHKTNDVSIENVTYKERTLEVTFSEQREKKQITLQVIGEHNALNAIATWIVGKQVGLTEKQIQQGLYAFTGTKRRAEYIGTLPSGAMLYDDYAHHPTEIQTTLTAFTNAFPTKRIVCIFQPHTSSRTKKLFEQFSNAFSMIDTVIVIPIYASSREEVDTSVSSELLVKAIQKTHSEAIFLPSAADVIKYLEQKEYGADTIVITMGAGDVYKIAEELIVNK